MENKYYEAFLDLRDNPKNNLKYREYEFTAKSKGLTKSAKSLFIFLYMVHNMNNEKDCSSGVLGMEEIKDIENSKTAMPHSLFKERYLKPHIKTISNTGIMEVSFLPFKREKKVIGGEFFIKGR